MSPTKLLEKALCQAWSEILKIQKDRISIKDNYFRLGGHSILAIKLASNLNNLLGQDINVDFLLKHPTISDFIEHLGKHSVNVQEIIPVNIDFPQQQVLSSSQERIWFIEKYEGRSNAYNIPIIGRHLNQKYQ